MTIRLALRTRGRIGTRGMGRGVGLGGMIVGLGRAIVALVVDFIFGGEEEEEEERGEIKLFVGSFIN